MKYDFYKNRKFLDNEFENAHFDKDTGIEPDVLWENMHRQIDNNTETPMPILRAKQLKYVLENAQIEINPYNMFADKLNIGELYTNWAQCNGVNERAFRYIRQKVLSENLPEVLKYKELCDSIGLCTCDADYWHTVPDWQSVLDLGFTGMLERAENAKNKRVAENNISKEQEIFYDSVIISLTAVIEYVKRLYKESLKYNIPQYSECMLALSKGAPETLYQAMQMSNLYLYVEEMGTEKARTLGNIDRLYYPYYLKDKKAGKTDEDIKEMLRFFFNKYNAARRGNNQPISLCGADIDGRPLENELTELMLSVWGELGGNDPKIHIQWHKNISERIMKQVLSFIADGKSSIVIINSDIVIKGYEKIGISRADAVNYITLGCYEPVLPGLEEAMIGTSWINISKAVELALWDGVDPQKNIAAGPATGKSFNSYEEFLSAFYIQLKSAVMTVMENVLKQVKYNMQVNPSPVYSAPIASCIERGKDVFDGGTKYRNTSVKCHSVATAVDSLLAVKKYVFEEKRITFLELKEILKGNWENAEELRREIRNDTNKYGNGLDEPDRLAKELYGFLADLIVGRDNTLGGVWRMGADSIHFNFIFGEKMGATPDGRRAGEPISKNFSASMGMDRNGVTALIKSVTEIDHSNFVNAAVLDLLLHPTAVQGEEGIDAFYSLLRVYFARGGLAVQGNVIKAETLIDAQNHPENYENLQIRICGWNEYFNRMNKKTQDAFIEQSRG